MKTEVLPQPNEIVESYIRKEFLSGTGIVSGRLPTISQMAKHLNISVPTVYSVIRKLVKEGLLETVQGRGTFIRNPQRRQNKTFVIGTALSAFQFFPSWSQEIYLGALKMAAAMQRNLSVLSLPPYNKASEIFHELERKMDHIDMLLLHGGWDRDVEVSHGYERLTRLYHEAGKPVVEINPRSVSATSNFVAADFYKAAVRLGCVWKEAGRRNICFLHTGVKYAGVSHELLRAGFINGIRADFDGQVRFQVVHATEKDAGFEQEFKNEIQESIRRIIAEASPAPDVIFCLSDIAALHVVEALSDAGVRVPEDVSVVGGTGFPAIYLHNHDLTRILQPMEQIGANAVRMLCHRYDNQCSAVPGLYLSTSIHPGSTTRPEENQLLQQYESLSA